MERWKNLDRPGYFGKRRDQKIADLNAKFGVGNWRLSWQVWFEHPESGYVDYDFDFLEACAKFYEWSYFKFLEKNPDLVNKACEYSECYDNAETNVQSGLDYSKQEAASTHIQDIAVRNALKRLGRSFTGKNGKLLQIRGADSEGYFLSPGKVSLYDPKLITQPSLAPKWADQGSVEDFWQSNKWIQVKSGS